MLTNSSEKVRAYCAQAAERLDDFDFDGKRLAFKALQITVVADPAGPLLKGALPYDLATIGQTSACVSRKHLMADCGVFVFHRNLSYSD